MDEIRKFDAIKALCPNAEFVLRGDTLEWLKANGDTKPSDSAITAKLAEEKELLVVLQFTHQQENKWQ